MIKEGRNEGMLENVLRDVFYVIGFICAKVNMIKNEARELFKDTGSSKTDTEEPVASGAYDSRDLVNAEFEKEIKGIKKEGARHLDALYAYFGRFLYENITKENVYYCFGSENARYEEEAESLLHKIKSSSEEDEAVQVRVRETDSLRHIRI
jgi:hypothetical protein